MIEEQERAEAPNEQREKRSILMFAYYFPPCVCWPTASMRAQGLASGLTQHGWDPIVVTRGNGCACLESRASDASTDTPSRSAVEVRGVEVHPSLLVRSSAAVDRWCESGPWRRVRFQFRKPIRKARAMTEKQDDWTRRALAEGRALLRERDVQAVWTTSGPYRTIGVGRRLQRRHRTPWVAELRDSIARERAWVGLLGRIAGRRQRRRWFRALKKATAVVDVTPQEAEIDSSALGREVHSLPAGFDLTVWESLRASDDSRWAPNARFTILYAGAFYGDRIEVGDLFFEGLRRFVDSESSPPEISFTYIGTHGAQVLAAAAKHDCRPIAEDGGVVSPARAQVMMTQADLLLLLAPRTREGGMPGGKLYEYLAAGPPILAVDGTDPYVLQVLRDTGAGEGAPSPDAIAGVLARRYESWRLDQPVPRSLDGLGSFTWPARAHQLADLLDSLVSPWSGGRGVMDPAEGVIA